MCEILSISSNVLFWGELRGRSMLNIIMAITFLFLRVAFSFPFFRIVFANFIRFFSFWWHWQHAAYLFSTRGSSSLLPPGVLPSTFDTMRVQHFLRNSPEVREGFQILPQAILPCTPFTGSKHFARAERKVHACIQLVLPRHIPRNTTYVRTVTVVSVPVRTVSLPQYSQSLPYSRKRYAPTSKAHPPLFVVCVALLFFSNECNSFPKRQRYHIHGVLIIVYVHSYASATSHFSYFAAFEQLRGFYQVVFIVSQLW